ncbi:hypothetical protein I601_0362 [Nocardioides dokdonensis FR1436]|uniref:Uncharacterized protein n=1 Tax=Nocardioides dokdonensis FR1436 TaxID=1300347 RepID=A0A1A9GH52_9ACTN|nr:hypothetical protein [Nocardioides dokdonensis]ANH36815.1 hypothetical protein I601_0362 [Nocardioides dokdonensis FR1436]
MSVARHAAIPSAHPRRARPRRTGAVRAARASLAVVLVGGLLSVGAAPAQAAPEQVLQSVDVQLGTDGTLTSVEATSVRRGEEGSDSGAATYDPVEAAEQLPVRIQTAYRLGDEAGTDLAEIAGRSGRVVIDVTVQNTTVEPEEVTYDAGGVQRSQFALVGVPLTVVASATLGEQGLARVVTEGAGQDEDVTNGVLSRSGAGDSRVQWATMLAPPRLAPSATFRLVLDAEDFVPPTFDIGVQPGLVTDTSLTGLLDEAFSDEKGGAVATEARTIEVIGDVSSVLTQASAVLTDIETRLSDSSERLGAQTIADLESSSAGVSEQLGSLSTDLTRLDGSLGDQLGGVQDDAVQALSSSLTEVKDVLGDPGRIKPPKPQDGAEGCRVDLGRNLAAPTVYGQLSAVSSRLSTLSNASGACRESIADDLVKQIGSAEQVVDCDETSTSAVCVLATARERLDEQAVVLVQFGQGLTGRFDSGAVKDLGSSLETVVKELDDIEDDANDLFADGTAPTRPLASLLGSLVGSLESLKTLLQPGSATGLQSAFASINTVAGTQAAAIGTPETPDSIAARAQALTAAVCAIPALADVTDTSQIPADVLQQIQDGLVARVDVARSAAGCAGGTTLSQRLAGVRTALLGVQQTSAVEGDGSVARALATLRGSVDTALAEVVAAVDETVGVADLRSIIARVAALGATAEPPSCEDITDRDPVGAVDALRFAYQRVSCNQDGLEKEIDKAFSEARKALGATGDEIGRSIGATDGARSKADKRIDELFGTLSQGADRAAERILDQGGRRIEKQRAGLDRQVRQAESRLGGAVGDALRVIGSNIQAANGDLDESEARLRADLQRVLVDLGTRESGGTGILGSLATGAGQTGVANDSVQLANARASAFGSVRGKALDEVFLQQAQTIRSLERQQEFRVFADGVDEDDTLLTVFSFHLGQG